MGVTARTLTYQYDGGGRRSRITFPDANYFDYAYAENGDPDLIAANDSYASNNYAHQRSL